MRINIIDSCYPLDVKVPATAPGSKDGVLLYHEAMDYVFLHPGTRELFPSLNPLDVSHNHHK